MITHLLVRLAGWRGYALACGLCLTAGFWGGWSVQGWKASEAAARTARAEAQALQRAVVAERSALQVSTAAGAGVEARTAAVRTVTRTLIEKVPIHVPADADARCVIPVGFVRLHDGAALGLSPAPVAPSQPDEAASGVELSAVARTVAGNYGACREAAEMVKGWQEFYAGVQAALGGGSAP